MPEEAIVTKALTKMFGRFTAVDGLNVSVGKGELFGLLGPNGAGEDNNRPNAVHPYRSDTWHG